MLKNETQFQITVLDTYFNSGHNWDSLTTVNPFTQMDFFLCNSDGSILTGVSGGTAFRTTMNEPVHFDFAVGWSNPGAGLMKASVVKASRGVYGYESLSPNGGSFMDDTVYQGVDDSGNPATLKLFFSAAGGQEPMYVVKGVIIVS